MLKPALPMVVVMTPFNLSVCSLHRWTNKTAQKSHINCGSNSNFALIYKAVMFLKLFSEPYACYHDIIVTSNS